MTTDTDAIDLVRTITSMHDDGLPDRVLVTVVKRAFAVERQRERDRCADVIQNECILRGEDWLGEVLIAAIRGELRESDDAL